MISFPVYFPGSASKEYKQCGNEIWTYIVIGIESFVIVLFIAWLILKKRYKNRNMQHMVPIALDNNMIKMKQTLDSNQTDNDYEEVVMFQNDNCSATQTNSNNRDPDARLNLIQELKQAALPRYLPMVPIYQKNRNNDLK